MNEVLKDKLRVIASDEITLQALKAIFNKWIEESKPNIEKTDDNQILGEKYRAYDQSREIIDRVFLDIESYNDIKVVKTKFNKEK